MCVFCVLGHLETARNAPKHTPTHFDNGVLTTITLDGIFEILHPTRFVARKAAAAEEFRPQHTGAHDACAASLVIDFPPPCAVVCLSVVVH